MLDRSLVRVLSVSLISISFLGCAVKSPQGYGVSARSNAAMAQAQFEAAQQATQLDSASTYLGLIEQMQQAGHWYASLAHTEAFEKEHGASPKILLLRADALRNTQQYERAKALYASLLRTAEAARAHRGLGLLHANQGEFDQAVESLEQARKLNPVDAHVLSDMGYALMRSGKFEQARLPILQSAQLAPHNARVQLNLALYWFVVGEQAVGGQVIQRLQQPQPPTNAPLIGQEAIDSLQDQLRLIRSESAAEDQGEKHSAVLSGSENAQPVTLALQKIFSLNSVTKNSGGRP